MGKFIKLLLFLLCAGMILISGGPSAWTQEKKQPEVEIPRKPLPENAVRLYASKDHMGNFFDCVRSRKLPICDVETGHRSANMCHLGAISLRTGHNLTWDYTAEKFTGRHASEANQYLVREMRKPYDYSFCG